MAEPLIDLGPVVISLDARSMTAATLGSEGSFSETSKASTESGSRSAVVSARVSESRSVAVSMTKALSLLLRLSLSFRVRQTLIVDE